jgi:alpha-mannosidase
MSGPKGGSLPATTGHCSVDAPNVVLLALKRAEDGDGLILRLWETEGRETEATIRLPSLRISKAWETNLVEENGRQLPVREDSLTVPAKAWGVSTVRLRWTQKR